MSDRETVTIPADDFNDIVKILKEWSFEFRTAVRYSPSIIHGRRVASIIENGEDRIAEILKKLGADYD